jgi:hypothetical protein
VITCHLRYEIDASKVDASERFATAWMELVERHGGTRYERTFMRPLLPHR